MVILPQWLGRKTYFEGLALQLQSLKNVQEDREQVSVLGLEHQAVVTLGKRGNANDDLMWSQQQLAQAGIVCVQIDRGGQATLHSPGQLVIYPVLDLKRHGLSVRRYVDLLLQSTKDLLGALGIPYQPSTDANEPGIYTTVGKVAFFGIRVQQGITQHGLAINVHNDPTLFASIRSCGRQQEQFDRVGNYINASLNEVFEHWLKHFKSRLLLASVSAGVELDPSSITQ